jgi:hypothetical protein
VQPLQPPVTGRLQTWGPTTRRVSGRTAPWPTSAPSSPRTTSPNPVTLRARHSWPGAYGAAHRAGHVHGIAGQRGVRVLRHRTGQQPAPAQIQRRGHYEESDRPYIPCFSSWLPAGYLPAHSLMTPSSRWPYPGTAIGCMAAPLVPHQCTDLRSRAVVLGYTAGQLSPGGARVPLPIRGERGDA